MRHRLLILLTCLFALNVMSSQAQQKLKFRVASFKQDPLDLSARNEEFKKMDSNGSLYAIIKVKSDVEDDNLQSFRFNFGMMNSFVELHDDLDELWIYVQKNAKTVTISREGYITISKYDLQTTIAAGATYLMQLAVQTPRVQHRILQFKVSPADESAIVKVKREDSSDDFELWGTVDASGAIDRRLETGVYLYEIAAENYETSEGRIILADAETNYVEEVTLKPNFGWLEIEDVDNIAGAEFYVDNRKIGTIPYTEKKKWPVREGYRLMISAGELYKTYNATFDIRKGEVTRLQPHLTSDFARTTITVEGDEKADIYVNGTRRGTGRWNGPLKAGAYTIESRRENHRSSTTQIVVKTGQEESFSIAAPTPITGSIYVSSQPSGARVFLDDVDRGQSPIELKNVLVGSHDVKLVLKNYNEEHQKVTVKEGETEETRFTLSNFVKSEVQPKTSSSAKEKSPSNQLFKPTNFYAQLGMNVGGLMAPMATLGAYVKDINVEASYLYPINGEEFIYWYKTGSGGHPYQTVFRPTWAAGGKVGYGIHFGKRLRLTPQVGGMLISVFDSNYDNSGYAITANIGARLDYAVFPFLGLYVAPEFMFPVSKSSVYQKISDGSDTVKGWSNGLCLRAGLTVFF